MKGKRKKGGRKLEVAQKWARGYISPCRVGGPRCFRAGVNIKSGPRVVGWLHNPCRPGIPDASKRGTKSEVAHKWAQWLHNA